MKLNILQLICLINYVVTFPNDLFDELWETNQSEPQTNNKPIESQPKIKIEPHEDQFDGRWQDESALKGNVKVEHELHYGAIKVEKQLEDHIKEEDQHGQAPYHDESIDEQQNESNKYEKIESDQQKREIIQKFRKIKDNYREKNKHAHSAKEWKQIEIKISNGLGVSRYKLHKRFKELGLSRETKVKLKFFDLEKREILKQFDEIKSKCKKANLKNISMRELDEKIAKKLGVSSGTISKWKRKFGLSVGNKFSELEKFKIVKQFDEIKSKCKKAKLKNGSKNELDEKISKKLGVCRRTIYEWKRKFGISVSNKTFFDAIKIGFSKKYAKIKGKNSKMTDAVIADMLKISTGSLSNWKKQFIEEIKKI